MNALDIFINKAKSIHGDRYDYSLVEYINCKTKVKIICDIHGVFEQTPDKHINCKNGCPSCAGNKVLTTTLFIEKAILVHGSKYDYSNVVYINNNTNVDIICNIHGVFQQTPTNHLAGKGCKYCAGNMTLTTTDFIKKAKLIHGDLYDYSFVDYINSKKPVIIVCKKHGAFKQLPYGHLSGSGCNKCGVINQKLHKNYETISEKIQQSCLQKYGVKNPMLDETIRLKHKIKVSSDDVNNKRILTKRKNNSFNTSKLEQQLYVWLKCTFAESDIYTNYISEKYPFKCDFYIQSRNLYIELNAHWSHGEHWYDSERDVLLVNKWSNGSTFYKNSLKTYTIRDVEKRLTAKKNNLNYIVFWKNDLSDAKLWFEHGCPDGKDYNEEYSWLSII